MTRPFKILFYTKGFPPREYGGPISASYNILSALLEHSSIEVHLFVQTDSTIDEISDLLDCPGNLSIVTLPYYPSARDFKLVLEASNAIRGVDVVHFNTFPFRHWPLILVSRLTGVPMVFRVGGLLTLEADAVFGGAFPLEFHMGSRRVRIKPPPVVVRFLMALYRACAPLWDAVVMNSASLVQCATELENFDRQRISIIPNGVTLRSPPDSPPREQNHLRLLYVGKLESIKGPDLLLDALSVLTESDPEVDLAVVGTGSLENTLKQKAEQLVRHRILFYGFRPREDLNRLYAWADVVAVPSRYDSFPNVVLEAMSLGRPLLATRVGGIPEILTHDRNALLVKPNAVSIAEGIRRLATDASLRRKMERANLTDVKKYEWDSIAQQYLDLYRKVAEVR